MNDLYRLKGDLGYVAVQGIFRHVSAGDLVDWTWVVQGDATLFSREAAYSVAAYIGGDLVRVVRKKEQCAW